MSWLLGRIRAWIVGLGAAIVVGAALVWQAWRSGYEDREAEENEDTLERLEEGRGRVRDNRDDDPAARLRANDGHW